MESESGQSDSTTVDPTRRIVKYFSKCLIELIKHAESIQFKKNKLVNYDVFSTANCDSENEIDITEHNIKSEFRKEGPIFKQIEKIQQCIVELLTICSQQNISIDYDTTKSNVSIYDCFDDPQRILIMNHLTLNTISIVENIYLSLKFLKNKNMDNGHQIKRSFSNIYKEIKSLPMRPDIINNMDSSFKSLTHKSEYKDSYNYLVDKLGILRKYICKFNKAYLKNYGCNDIFLTEDSTDDDNTPRKKNRNKILEKTYVNPENNDLNVDKEQEAVFKIPISIDNVNPNTDSTNINSGETPKKRKRNMTTNANSYETPEKNNRKTNTDTDKDVISNNESVENMDTTNKYSDETPKKKNRKINTDSNKESSVNCEEQEPVLCEIPESLENINANLDAKNTYINETPKKKKRSINTDSVKEISDNCEPENMDTTNTNSHKTPNKISTDTEKEINDDSEEQLVLNTSSNKDATNKDSDVSHKKKKHKVNTDAEKEINDDSAKLSERNLLLNELLIDTMNKVNTNQDTEKKHKKKKESKNKTTHKSKDSSPKDLNNSANSSNQKQNVDIESTNNKDLSPEEILKILKKRKAEEEITKKSKKPKVEKPKKNTKPPLNNAEDNQSDDELNEELINSFAASFLSVEYNDTENDDNSADDDAVSADILNAINTGNVEIDYDNTEFEEFTKMMKKHDLNDNERFLYIQDLIETANARVAISEEKQQKMANLNILVDWEVCPAHLICSTLTGGPNDEEKELLKKHGVTLGPFSKKEDEILKENWKTFCKAHDLEEDPAPFIVVALNKQKLLSVSERKKFVQYMGRGLPHKSLYSIFRRFRSLFKPKVKTGRFSPEEDELILTYISKMNRVQQKYKYVRLAPLINRDRWQIERRFRTLKEAAQQSSKKTQWNLELKEKFLKHLLEETHSESVDDLRNKHIDLDTYTLIGKLMNIPALKLKLHWKFHLYNELFSAEETDTDLIKIKLIKKFHELQCDDWKTVDWKQIKAMFNGINQNYLWITLKNVIHVHVPSKMQENLKDSIDFLYRNCIEILEKKRDVGKSNMMPRLKYENGTLTKCK